MRFFCIKNLISHDVFELAPWDFKPQSNVQLNSKEAVRKWWRTPSTNHLFYSMFEGTRPDTRTSWDNSENPPSKMHGFVVDYDEKITDKMYKQPNLANTAFHPTAWSLTSSGRGRMLWAFEKPIPLPDKKMTSNFLKLIAKEMKLKDIWPGFDEAFYRATQYYECGHHWKVFDNYTIPCETVSAWLLKSWDKHERRSALRIPMDEIYAELERKYPKVWEGPFEIGARTRRFWDPAATNPTSAVLRENGFQCFSGDKAFVSWQEILGNSFVLKIESTQIEKISNGIFFDGRTYFRQTDDNKWLSYCKDDIKLYLRVRLGLTDKSSSRADTSELDRTLCFVQETNRIEAAMPFVHHRPGVIIVDGKRYLNTFACKALQPVDPDADVTPKDFPWLHDFFMNMFEDKEDLSYMFGWLKRFYESGLYYIPRNGQAIFIAGHVNMGKTMLADYIIAKMMGGFRDASSYFLGEVSGFSAPYLEVPLLTINDTQAIMDNAKHNRYSSMIKKMVANKDFMFNQKYEKAGSVKWTGRIVVTCNVDPESLRVLPNLEMSMREKVMLFKMKQAKKDFQEGFTNKIDNELPYFCRWLLDWAVPRDIVTDSRFGVRSRHHHELYNVAIQSGSSQGFLEILMIFLKNAETRTIDGYWEGSTAELLSEMLQLEATKALCVKITPQGVGRMLGQLQARGYPLFNKHTRRGSRWSIPYDVAEMTPAKAGHENDDPEELSRISEELQDDSYESESEPVRGQQSLPF